MRHVSLSLAILFTAVTAHAAAPSVLSYTGTMADASGAAVPNGTYELTASLFGAETGGTALWSETVNVRTDAGVFNALLGAGTTSFDETALDAAELWLELAVDGDTLDPRLRVASVPYALQAGSAAFADELTCDGCVSLQHIDETQVQTRISGTPCSPGNAVTAIAPDGMATCGPAMALAGSGSAPTGARSDHAHPLAGSGTAPTAAHSDHDHTGTYLPRGTILSCANPATEKVVAVDSLTGDVTCDLDAVTTYTGGTGISVLGTTIAVAFADTLCTGTDKLTGFVAGVPACAPDIDTDTDIDTQHTLTQVPRANSLIVADSGNTGRYTSITIGTDTLPVISYRDGGGADDLMVLKCLTPDCSANVATPVDGPNIVGDHTSIAIGTDGFPVISYYDTTNTALKVAKCADAACLSSTSLIVDGSGLSDMGARNSLAIGTDGFPIIAYRDATALTLLVAHCTTANCVSKDIYTVDGANGGDYVSIAIGADGMPVMAYRDVALSDLKVAKCVDVACASPATITLVDGIGGQNVGSHPSIAIGADGFPVISYYDSETGFLDLKVAKCVDLACASPATITPVDGAGPADIGEYTSITIGVDGLPYISYHDATSGTLRLARCGDAACSAGNHLLTLDPGGGNIVGTETSITIGGDGLPVISYRDVTSAALKVAKCGNALCIPNWTRR